MHKQIQTHTHIHTHTFSGINVQLNFLSEFLIVEGAERIPAFSLNTTVHAVRAFSLCLSLFVFLCLSPHLSLSVCVCVYVSLSLSTCVFLTLSLFLCFSLCLSLARLQTSLWVYFTGSFFQHALSISVSPSSFVSDTVFLPLCESRPDLLTVPVPTQSPISIFK